MKTSSDDLWLQIIAEDGAGDQPPPSTSQQNQQPTIAVKYQRRKTVCPVNLPPRSRSSSSSFNSSSVLSNESRPSLVPNNSKRVSWNRSLSTRGRLSIAVTVYANCQPQPPGPRRRGKPALPKGKVVQPPNHDKERAYFQEVDQFELLEESPSPKKFTWVVEDQAEDVALPTVCIRLEKWLLAKRGNYMPSSSLSTILDTPGGSPLEPIPFESYSATGNDAYPRRDSNLGSAESLQPNSRNNSLNLPDIGKADIGDVEASIRKLSLSEQPPLEGDQSDPFYQLLRECGQSAPFSLSDVFSKLCEPEKIVKIGEGTYGEAFIAGDSVCKIVPIDGDLRVNGELQKRSFELLEEVVLSLTLNQLRANESDRRNATTIFIETKALRVCEGLYDSALLKAWEAWDAKHGSENDHPGQFHRQQHYVVFVLEHGGTDLENFVLLDFDEAQSLLVQVTAALAVAEAAYEFEHRDLHWGNILLSRKEMSTMHCTLEGKKYFVKTFGVSVSIIDFTLSRINTGNTILYLDLSSDPELFEGPKRDKQAETYRKMRDLTDECWEESSPKTNVFWLQYLVDILLLKKSFKRTAKDERDLRSFKKRMINYNSAKETITDSFFSGVLFDHPI